jgi:GNAT superfamily N-acetyltransferase
MNSTEVEIKPFTPKDADAFRSLNEEWITTYFGMEEEDHFQLNDPESHILKPGGQIFMAFLNGAPVGCCALIPMKAGVFELAKMAVAPGFQGHGIGRKILAHTIDEARRRGMKRLFLGSNSKLGSAVHLYESFGFRHLKPEEIPPSPYARANVFMELDL